MRSFDLTNSINQSLAHLKTGSLCFWGDWFGKPYDNNHRITSATTTDEFDVIYFNEGESLLLKNPRGWSLSRGKLLIKDADVVRWQWFYYGRAPGPDSLQFIEYRRADGEIDVSTDFMPDFPHSVDLRSPAVELHVL
jgi:hypothetical protein